MLVSSFQQYLYSLGPYENGKPLVQWTENVWESHQNLDENCLSSCVKTQVNWACCYPPAFSNLNGHAADCILTLGLGEKADPDSGGPG